MILVMPFNMGVKLFQKNNYSNKIYFFNIQKSLFFTKKRLQIPFDIFLKKSKKKCYFCVPQSSNSLELWFLNRQFKEY